MSFQEANTPLTSSPIQRIGHGDVSSQTSPRHVTPPLTFMELPMDILLLISDELSLVSMVAVSRTCSAMRNLLHSKCVAAIATIRLPTKTIERWVFLAERTNYEPGCLLCMPCRKRHNIDPSDISDVPSGRPSFSNECRYPCGASWTVRNHLRHHHASALFPAYNQIQLALKYARKRNAPHLLSSLLAPQTGLPTDGNIWDCVKVADFIARPKIVNNRFLLHSTWKLNLPNKVRSTLTKAVANSLPDFRICLHHGLNLGWIERELFRTRLGAGSQICSSGCAYCPIGFSIGVIVKYSIFQIWQDLGTQGPPTDAPWRSVKLDSSYPRNDDGEILRAFGSIRDTYNEA
ncbi:uncharacterized protein BDZ99DRAFT_559539 [Mytilinidion resinicola]|uniref:F-box domain-containing protein n=1 Tax=Mytilinidion resinicola TaxID=574789 RepID=A0A6A6YSI2_9PEZI|nr:uncharacterized protein BDZ99DRAFT_559539 [Mytilinidion resinicola]KAF2811508.1 hypothetical protein BDZ99DRAFT_559539 [Mytilinidion resinicola]